VVVVHVIRQLAHQRGMHLLELAEGLLASVKDRFVADLPAFELARLPGSLFSVHLEQFTRDFKLLTLHFELLALNLERLALEVGQEVEQKDGIVGVGDGTGRVLPSRGDLHAVGPGWGGGGWIFSRGHNLPPSLVPLGNRGFLRVGVRRGLAEIPDNGSILRQVALSAKAIGEQFL